MRVTVKLFALLGRHLPADARSNQAQLDVPEGATPADVFQQLGVPPGNCHLVLINGVYVEPGERTTRALSEGDTLAAWPPIAGGRS